MDKSSSQSRSGGLISNDELQAILADVKDMWVALVSMASASSANAAVIATRMQLPQVIDMVFEQASTAPSESGRQDAKDLARYRWLRGYTTDYSLMAMAGLCGEAMDEWIDKEMARDK